MQEDAGFDLLGVHHSHDTWNITPMILVQDKLLAVADLQHELDIFAQCNAFPAT